MLLIETNIFNQILKTMKSSRIKKKFLDEDVLIFPLNHRLERLV